MKIIIEGKIGEEDLVIFARILREMWRHREDRLFVFIEPNKAEGEMMTSEECQELFRQIFSNDKDWKPVGKLTKEHYEEFLERMKK